MAAALVTFTVTVQEALAGTVPADSATLLPPPAADQVLDALAQKYGLRGRLASWRARRGDRPSAAIGITLVS